MDETMILDAVERYIRGEMTPDDRVHFENLRKTNPEVDQLVVEHTLFLQQMNRFGEWKKFKSALHETHTNLSAKGAINSDTLKGKSKVIYLWNRYKRVAAIAATIAGITALTVSSMVNVLSPKAPNSQLERLGRKVDDLEKKNRVITSEIKDVKTTIRNSKIEPGTTIKGGGTAFMIDGKGYLVTNAHILANGKNVVVEGSKGEQYKAETVKIDAAKDLAILRIKDDDFKPITSLPYGITKSSTSVAERIYTLGYPRNDIVYSEGYLSARTGFEGDTLSCQLGIAVNHGNSGGPVFNKNGEVIGILSTKEKQAEGVAFAIQSKYIYTAIEELKKEDTAYKNLRLSPGSSLRGLAPSSQFDKIQHFVFLVRSY